MTPEEARGRLAAGEQPLDVLAEEDGGALLELRPRGQPPLRAHGGVLGLVLLAGVPALMALLVLGAVRAAAREGGDVSVTVTWRVITLSVDRTRTGERPARFGLPGPLAALPNPLFPGVEVPLVLVVAAIAGGVQLARVAAWRRRRLVVTRLRVLTTGPPHGLVMVPRAGLLAVEAGRRDVTLQGPGGFRTIEGVEPEDAPRLAEALALPLRPAPAAPGPRALRERGLGLAILGLVAWFGACLALLIAHDGLALPDAALLLAAFVVLPMALGLAPAPLDRPHGHAARALGAARALQPWAALLLAPATLWPRGPFAAALSLPWVVVCGLVAAGGALRAWRRGRAGLADREELCVDAGCALLGVGGAWTLAARLGLRPLGFDDLIVALTAVHFHFAGLGLPLLLGLTGRARGGLPAWLVALVLGGVPLVAVGITTSRAVEWVAAWTLAAGAMGAALLQLLEAARHGPRGVRALLGLSGLSLAAGMLLAALYGLGRVLPLPWPTIEQMIPSHGLLNGLGFVVVGLLARSFMASPLEGLPELIDDVYRAQAPPSPG